MSSKFSSRFESILHNFSPLAKRATNTAEKLKQIRAKFEQYKNIYLGRKITIFCAGSIGRKDSGRKSDLDLFIIADEEITPLDTIYFLANLININSELEYEKFSNNGEFLKVYQLKDLTDLTGSREEDSQNIFTARLLLLLESTSVCNIEVYDDSLRRVIEHYCRDEKNHNSFRPLFLLNDILRYWRTLCLNYERIRHDPNRPWRKKNVNLKFSRMLTVYGTVLPLIAGSDSSHQGIADLCQKSPLERLAIGLDKIGDPALENSFQNFLANYEYFLALKENEAIKDDLASTTKRELDRKADEFSSFLYTALTHQKIPEIYRKYLVI